MHVCIIVIVIVVVSDIDIDIDIAVTVTVVVTVVVITVAAWKWWRSAIADDVSWKVIVDVATLAIHSSSSSSSSSSLRTTPNLLLLFFLLLIVPNLAIFSRSSSSSSTYYGACWFWFWFWFWHYSIVFLISTAENITFELVKSFGYTVCKARCELRIALLLPSLRANNTTSLIQRREKQKVTTMENAIRCRLLPSHSRPDFLRRLEVGRRGQ